MSITTYGKIEVEPFEIKIINLLEIIRKPNEHTKLNLTGMLNEEINKSYVEQMIEQKTIKIKAEIPVKNKETGESELSKEVIFSGIVENIEVKSASNMYEIKIEGISHSKKLDIELINRSYQDFSMTYEDVMKKSISKYGGDLIDKATEGATTEEFILCYRESSWEFIKRLSSRFEKPLVPEDKLDEPKEYAGVPNKDEVGELEDFAYSIKKRTNLYRETKEKYKKNSFETDYIYYEIITEKIFEIGNKVTFQGRTLYVNEAEIRMDNGIFSNTYKLTEKSGFHENMIKNEQIVGLSLEGKVINVAKDDVQISLDIDKETPPDDFCWFKYSTPYTSENGGGFYNMPGATRFSITM